MPGPQTESVCTVKLLSIAAQAIYRVKQGNIIDPTYSDDYNQTIIDIANHGYAITKAIVPIGSKGTGTTPLGALCLQPQDTQSPIIISFRGTKTGSDVLSDIRLGVAGTVDKEFRDSAFKFYEEVRQANPEREIILTGHSLGGNIAHYVATRAYNTDSDLLKAPLLHVRTFNTAPMDTKHSSVFLKAPHVLTQFVNYRLSSDVVSDLPLQRYQGNTFVFPCEKGALGAHPMGAINEFIPKVVMQQRVGNSSEGSKEHHQLIELTNGILNSYQCRVEGQFFSRFRAGAKNLAEMQRTFPEVMEHINKGEYDEAVLKLAELKEKLNGNTSNQMIDALMRKTINVKVKNRMEASDSLELKAPTAQELIKLSLRQGREKEQSKELENEIVPPAIASKL